MRFFKIFLLIVVLAFITHRVFFSAPSEAQMIAHFRAHRAEFEQLRVMLQQDTQVFEIGNDWVSSRQSSSIDTLANAGISQQRLNAYHALMKQLSVTPIGRLSSGTDYFQFNVFGGGFADTTWSVGYVWSKNPPGNIVASAYQLSGAMRGNRVHSVLEGDWYIFQRR